MEEASAAAQPEQPSPEPVKSNTNFRNGQHMLVSNMMGEMGEGILTLLQPLERGDCVSCSPVKACL